MRKYRHALTFTVLGLPLMAVAQVSVVDYEQGAASGGSGYSTAAPSGDGAYAGGGAAAPSSAQGMLFLQLQQMQEEIAQLRGMLEEQQNQIQRLEQQGLERYKDLDSRLSGSASAGNQPSTAAAELAGEWPHGYSRQQAVYPLPSLVEGKYWPPVGRVDNVYGDRNLICSCPAPRAPLQKSFPLPRSRWAISPMNPLSPCPTSGRLSRRFRENKAWSPPRSRWAALDQSWIRLRGRQAPSTPAG